MGKEIAVGTKVFKRTEKLKDLLASVPEFISTVYVADDGRTTKREHIYSDSYPFDLTLIDLDYDEGLGAGRRAIVERMTEDYLVIVDSDHVLPDNLDVLQNLLESNPDVGGVAGAVIEPEIPSFFVTGQQFVEKGDDLHRGPFLGQGDVSVEMTGGYPIVYFDLVANAAMFRRECLEDYNWDPKYVIGYEHVDFYVGHWKQTDWEFTVCPSVVFEHYPGGGSEYNANRYDNNKISSSEKYFLDKWGYEEDVIDGGFQWALGPPGSTWYSRGNMSTWQEAIVIGVVEGPRRLGKRAWSRLKRRFF